MKILIAETAGFCFGVQRAVNLAEETAAKHPGCITLGPLIHNQNVVDRLAEKGVGIAQDLSQVRPGQTVIIRSHGIGREEYETLSRMGCTVIDATCPVVAKIHRTVAEESEKGRIILIVGERCHPEVVAISGWCSRFLIVETPEELQNWLDSDEKLRDLPISVVSQTTGSIENFKLCVNILKKQCTNYLIFDTICSTTSKRQSEAAELAEKCDAMIVIGGKHSANSNRLAEICREKCPKVFFVESAEELQCAQFDGVGILGITAGASTPAWNIKEVNQKMCDETKATDTAEKETFEEMLEKSIKTLHTGEKVSGTVAAITPTEVSVELGIKQSGYIPTSELSNDPNVKAEDIVHVGDEVEAYVMRVNDVEGTVMLSKKRLDSVKAWDEIVADKDDRTVLEGTVVEVNKGGVVAYVKGIRVFIPASQTGLPKDAVMDSLVKQTVKLRITEVNQARRRVVGSIRAVAAEERKARAGQIWSEIEVGKHYKGTVKSLTSYGAFVDIGGIDGMIHVSEISWTRIKQPSDVLSIGDEIEVYVISFDKDKKKISLGYKNPEQNPWALFTAQFAVGDVANVKIVKLMPFGAFAEIIPGVDGLIHISQIADRRIGKPEDVLKVNETVDAKIIDIDTEKQKVSLSIRALLAPQESRPEEANHAPEQAE